MLNWVFLILINIIYVTSDYQTIMSYSPSSNVQDRLELDKDIRDINNFLEEGDYNNSLLIYKYGKNSIKNDNTIRNLRSFSTDSLTKMSNEQMFQLYSSYYNNPYYANDLIIDFFNSDYNNIIKNEVILKGIQYLSLWMYIIHELEDSINDCIEGNLNNNIGNVHAWDEAWAFYTGSLESGNRDGFSIYTLANKRCKDFNTCISDENTNSLVNSKILELFNKGKYELIYKNCHNLYNLKINIIKLMTIPLIQGTLKYIYLMDPNGGSGSYKEKAEGYIFSKTILPQINYCNPDIAIKFENNLNLDNIINDKFNYDGYVNLKKNLESIYNCLNITCKEIGGLVSYDNNYIANMEPCNDYLNDNFNILLFIVIPLIIFFIFIIFISFIIYRYRKINRKYNAIMVRLNNNSNITLSETEITSTSNNNINNNENV